MRMTGRGVAELYRGDLYIREMRSSKNASINRWRAKRSDSILSFDTVCLSMRINARYNDRNGAISMRVVWTFSSQGLLWECVPRKARRVHHRKRLSLLPFCLTLASSSPTLVTLLSAATLPFQTSMYTASSISIDMKHREPSPRPVPCSLFP
jgi:hypothetical protein